MRKIVFFGLGAVGSVMACALYELCQRNANNQVRFVFVVRDIKTVKQYLFRAPHVLKISRFLELKDFSILFQNSKKYSEYLEGADVFINTATPGLNEKILKLSIEFKASYCDLASDMYNARTLKTLKFSQQSFHEKLQKSGVFGLINVGISPGVTNFLVGEKLMDLKQSNNLIKVKEINLYLLEHIESNQVVFSWSPTIALDELEQRPRYLKDKNLTAIQPFSESQQYEFPHFQGKVAQYPIYQEEVLSFHDSFPEINSLRVSSGGSEVELIKNLFQLNLLSRKDIKCVEAKMSVDKIVRMVLPGMQSPQKIEKMLADEIIKYAQFAAIAEIILEVQKDKKRIVLMNEAIGLSFNTYQQLLGTPYSGATYISYPTGVGAAILLFYTYQSWQKDKKKFSGVIKAEELPAKIGSNVVYEIKCVMSSFMIEFVSHTHCFKDQKEVFKNG